MGSVLVDGFVVGSVCWWRVVFGGELLGGAVWGGQLLLAGSFCWRRVVGWGVWYGQCFGWRGFVGG